MLCSPWSLGQLRTCEVLQCDDTGQTFAVLGQCLFIEEKNRCTCLRIPEGITWLDSCLGQGHLWRLSSCRPTGQIHPVRALGETVQAGERVLEVEPNTRDHIPALKCHAQIYVLVTRSIRQDQVPFPVILATLGQRPAVA